MSDKQVVLAIFPDEAAADNAVTALKAWDRASDEVKLNSIGVLVLDDVNHVKTRKLGHRTVGAGAGIGLVLALVTPVGWVSGIVGGGVLGALHRKGLGLKKADRERIARDLSDGKAAVGVLAAADEAEMIAGKLVELGGIAEVHGISEAELQEAAKADTGVPAG